MTDAQNGNNGANGGPGRDGRDSVNKPDPSNRTLESLEREILHLRELIEARLDNIDKAAIATQTSNQKALDAATVSSNTAVNAAQLAADKAVSAALEASNKSILELDTSITRRITSVIELNDAKFVTYGTLLESQSQKVALALESAKEAVAKAEQFNNQQFITMNEKIDDLKKYQFSSIGKGAGVSALYGWLVAGIGLLISVIIFANSLNK